MHPYNLDLEALEKELEAEQRRVDEAEAAAAAAAAVEDSARARGEVAAKKIKLKKCQDTQRDAAAALDPATASKAGTRTPRGASRTTASPESVDASCAWLSENSVALCFSTELADFQANKVGVGGCKLDPRSPASKRLQVSKFQPKRRYNSFQLEPGFY